ncbi:MAG: hypothetical protein EBT50_03195 [Verrucomicrobia bacterium]|nr:hypothetical protein [Verrucomicrobiota bacterium]
MKMRIKKAFVVLVAVLSLVEVVGAAEKGPTIVVKKDERRIAGLSTNGITRWTASLGQEGDEVTAVNQSGNVAMVSVTNRKSGKTRILTYDADQGILKFSKTVN